MTRQSLTTLLVELYLRIHGRAPDPSFAASIDSLRYDYDLEEDGQVPTWLSDALEALLQQKETAAVRFEKIGSDVSSFLTEASELVPGWEHDDQGEWIELRVPALGARLLISREALSSTGAGCCSYVVKPL